MTQTKDTQPKAVPETSLSDAFELNGPGGTVALGDGLGAAQKAFPPAKGSHVFDQAMSFAITGQEGWAWSEDVSHFAFEAALQNGKIVGLVLTEMKAAPTTKDVEDIIAKIGKPTRRADGKTCSVLVWDQGENARFTILLKEDMLILGKGTMTLIGRKDDLKLLSYRADDPETTVKVLDAGAEQLKKLKR